MTTSDQWLDTLTEVRDAIDARLPGDWHITPAYWTGPTNSATAVLQIDGLEVCNGETQYQHLLGDGPVDTYLCRSLERVCMEQREGLSPLGDLSSMARVLMDLLAIAITAHEGDIDVPKTTRP